MRAYRANFMNKYFWILTGVLLLSIRSFGQSSGEKVAYVIDSIRVVSDPEEGDDILPGNIADMSVMKNKDSLKMLGYDSVDAVTFVFTRAYRNRPESVRQIPSSKQMKISDGVLLFRGSPYSGQFIDYYYSGRRQGDGTLINGKVTGLRKTYYQDGNIKSESIFQDGLENGLYYEYYEDGTLSQNGAYLKGKEEGIWEDYFPNAMLKMRRTYKGGEIMDSAYKFYSTGKIKEAVFIKNGKIIYTPIEANIQQLMSKSGESTKAGDLKAAIKYCTSVIDLDSTYADAYYLRGTLELDDLQFDKSIADFDKALNYEPFLDAAWANRAFARIRKYQLADSRTLSKNNDVTVLASKDKAAIPPEEQEKICSDLKKAIFLGQKSKMILDAMADNCQK
jgi:tetratricopeptide (TPR) repeat protein